MTVIYELHCNFILYVIIMYLRSKAKYKSLISLKKLQYNSNKTILTDQGLNKD